MSRVVEHLRNLIRIPSVSSMTNRPVVEYAEAALVSAGWHSRRQTYLDDAQVEKINLVAAPVGHSIEDRAAIGFVCHTDTVPYAAHWMAAVSPFEREGFVHGCGACDVKGFLACLLTAAELLNPREFANVRIVLTADEEVGCVGAKNLLASGLFQAEKLVIGEPTGLSPARAGKGYCVAEVRVAGQEAHSAHPEKGASAILGAAHLLHELEQFAELLKQDANSFFSPSYTTVNVGTIHGGTAKNIIPGECTFLLEWRPVPGARADRIPSELEEVIRRAQAAHPRLTYELSILRQQQGFETLSKSVLVRTLESLTGRGAISIPFGSEASVLAAICDEMVVFGPGDMQSAHSDRECVEIAQLNEACDCLRSLMKSAPEQ